MYGQSEFPCILCTLQLILVHAFIVPKCYGGAAMIATPLFQRAFLQTAFQFSFIYHFIQCPTLLSRSIFTVRRSALHGPWDRNSVRLSVCHTRGLCPHGSTYDHDFFTVW